MEIKSITERTVEHLRSKIITGELIGGHKLNTADLTAQLDISVPPLREALRILEKDNLIVSIPRKGAYVSKLSLGDLQNVFQAREMFECYAIDILKEKKIRELPDVSSAISIAAGLSEPSHQNSQEMLKYFMIRSSCHLKLVQASSNDWLVNFYNSIYYHLARYEFIHTHLPGRKKRLLEHDYILKLIEAGSYSEAKKKLRFHIRTTYENLRIKILQNEINKEG